MFAAYLPFLQIHVCKQFDEIRNMRKYGQLPDFKKKVGNEKVEAQLINRIDGRADRQTGMQADLEEDGGTNRQKMKDSYQTNRKIIRRNINLMRKIEIRKVNGQERKLGNE